MQYKFNTNLLEPVSKLIIYILYKTCVSILEPLINVLDNYLTYYICKLFVYLYICIHEYIIYIPEFDEELFIALLIGILSGIL